MLIPNIEFEIWITSSSSIYLSRFPCRFPEERDKLRNTDTSAFIDQTRPVRYFTAKLQIYDK